MINDVVTLSEYYLRLQMKDRSFQINNYICKSVAGRWRFFMVFSDYKLKIRRFMNIYYGVLKDGFYFTRVKKILKESGVKVLDYYSDYRIVKFKSIKEFTVMDFEFFLSVESEMEGFPEAEELIILPAE